MAHRTKKPKVSPPVATIELTPTQERKRKRAFAGKQFKIQIKPIRNPNTGKIADLSKRASIEFQLLPRGRTKTTVTLPRRRRFLGLF